MGQAPRIPPPNRREPGAHTQQTAESEHSEDQGLAVSAQQCSDLKPALESCGFQFLSHVSSLKISDVIHTTAGQGCPPCAQL